MGVQESHCDTNFISFRYTPRSGITELYDSFTFNFLGTSRLFLHYDCVNYILANNVQVLSTLVIFCVFDNSQSN